MCTHLSFAVGKVEQTFGIMDLYDQAGMIKINDAHYACDKAEVCVQDDRIASRVPGLERNTKNSIKLFSSQLHHGLFCFMESWSASGCLAVLFQFQVSLCSKYNALCSHYVYSSLPFVGNIPNITKMLNMFRWAPFSFFFLSNFCFFIFSLIFVVYNDSNIVAISFLFSFLF